jgi:hypothetical protein
MNAIEWRAVWHLLGAVYHKETVMADQNNAGSKVGSNPDAARSFAGKGDFGIHADDAKRDPTMPQMDPDVSERPAHGMFTDTDGQRVHGVGGDPQSGPGASSGGDLDTDLIGLDGSGGGVSQSGSIGDTEGPDITEGGTTDPDTVDRSKHRAQVGGNKQIQGDALTHDDDPAAA